MSIDERSLLYEMEMWGRSSSMGCGKLGTKSFYFYLGFDFFLLKLKFNLFKLTTHPIITHNQIR